MRTLHSHKAATRSTSLLQLRYAPICLSDTAESLSSRIPFLVSEKDQLRDHDGAISSFVAGILDYFVPLSHPDECTHVDHLVINFISRRTVTRPLRSQCERWYDGEVDSHQDTSLTLNFRLNIYLQIYTLHVPNAINAT